MLPTAQLLTEVASQWLPIVTSAAVLLASIAVSILLCGGDKKAKPSDAPNKDPVPPAAPDEKAAPAKNGDEEKPKTLDAAQDKPKSTDGRLQPKSAFGA
ncbi:hypothetical protein AAVH_11744 [Aphelenchoides avenae]|nr:hypothetical protein AAVH_11744 [Aphelenchus avenae]